MKRKIKSENVRRRLRRAMSVRKKISGSAERPRLSVFRSSKHIYAQLVNDEAGETIASASTRSTDGRSKCDELKKTDAAEQIGRLLADAAKAKGIEKVVFDRGGWAFHGRVAALAKGARDGGLQF
jgi:large subunit ribosomal protein L18